MNYQTTALLVCIMTTSQSWGMQQVQAIKWQRPDVMLTQAVDSFDNASTFKHKLIIVGSSIGAGTALWSLAHAKQKASELKIRLKRSANDAHLRDQRSLIPLTSPIISIQAARQKPPLEIKNKPDGTGTDIVNTPVGRDVGKLIVSFLPNETFAKEHHKKITDECQAELDAATTRNTNLKRMAWSIPIVTWGILDKIGTIRSIIISCNHWILTPIVDLTLNLKQGEFRKTVKPLMWCGVAYLLIKNRGLIRRALLGF